MNRQGIQQQPVGLPDRRAGGPAHSREVGFVRVGSLRLRISRQGTGPPLLLIGGLGNNLGVWDNLVRELPDFSTIAVDAPGTGSSTTPVVPLSMAELAEVYAGLVEELGLARVTVLGHSLGGAVAQQLAHQTPGLVSGLVLCGTGPGTGGVPGTMAALNELVSPLQYYSVAQLRRIAPLVCGGWLARELRDLAPELDDRLTFPPSIYGYYCQLAALVGWTSFPWLASIAAPTLVIAADADPVYPLANSRLLRRLIPKARLKVVPGGGHQFVMQNADDVAPLVRAFIDSEVDSRYSAVAV